MLGGVKDTTVALAYMVLVLLCSLLGGFGTGIFASIAATLCLNYFFLPPVGTFSIDRSQDWMALAAFLISAGVVSQLLSSLRKRALEAERTSEELAGLYRLSQTLMTQPQALDEPERISRAVGDAFSLQLCRFHAPSGARLDVLAGEHEAGVRYLPLQSEGKPLGTLVIKPDRLRQGTLEAISGLLALSLTKS